MDDKNRKDNEEKAKEGERFEPGPGDRLDEREEQLGPPPPRKDDDDNGPEDLAA